MSVAFCLPDVFKYHLERRSIHSNQLPPVQSQALLHIYTLTYNLSLTTSDLPSPCSPPWHSPCGLGDFWAFSPIFGRFFNIRPLVGDFGKIAGGVR